MTRQISLAITSMRQIFLALILCLNIQNALFASEPRFFVMDASSGLPQASVHALAQDKYGMLWIGTENGLARYDGRTVKNFTHHPDDAYSLPDNMVNALFYSQSGHLWVGTEADGASYYDFESDKFIAINTDLIGKEILGFYDYRDDSGIIIVSRNGVFYRTHAGDTKPLFKPAAAYKVLDITTKNSRINIVLDSGERFSLADVSSEPQQVTFFEFPIKKLWHLSSCSDLALNASGQFWCYDNGEVTASNLNQILKDAGIPIDQWSIYDLVEDQNQHIWISSNAGLIEAKNDKARVYTSHPEDLHSLSSNKLSRLLLGQQGELFIGTRVKGINILNLEHSGIESVRILDFSPQLKQTPLITDGCSDSNPTDFNTVWSILKDSEEALWVGNNGGLAVRTSPTDSFKGFTRVGNDTAYFDVCSVWSLAEAKGKIWIGTWKGLLAFDKSNGGVTRYISQEKDPNITSDKALSGHAIRILLHDKQRNSLWIGTNYNGLNRLDFTTGTIHQYSAIPKNSSSLPHNRIRSLYLDNDNQLWVGSSGGLSLWQEETDTFKTLPASNDPAHLSDEDVRAIYQLNASQLWVGTGNGMNLVNSDDFTVEKRLYERNGLSNSNMYSFVPDKLGHLWISTANGVSRFHLQQETFDNYAFYQGLQSNEFNFNAWFLDDDGTIILGGINGLTTISPANISSQPATYPAVITAITGFDDTGTAQALSNITAIDTVATLQTQLRNIRISYAIPSYGQQIGLKSQYYLSPHSSKWSHSSPLSHYVDYTNLDPGRNDFHLKTTIGTDNGQSLSLNIVPTFWETTLFKVLAISAIVLITALLSYLFQRARVALTINRAAQQHYRIVEHELRPHLIEANNKLKQLIDSDHNNPNKKIIQDSITPLLGKSIDFITDLRSFVDIRQTLKQQKQAYMLEDIADDISLLFDHERERLFFDDIADVNILAHENTVYLILKNLVSNALKYSEKHRPVHIKLTAKDADLIISCADQGIGIDKQHIHQIYKPYTRLNNDYMNAEGIGIGLSVVKYIVHIYKGSIAIKNNTPQGSIFTVTLRGVVLDD